jgi:lipoprotein-anchoring transpeptidase ErfK/SrfK
VLGALIVADWEAPVIRGWFATEKPELLPDKPTIAPVPLTLPMKPPVAHQPTADEIRMKKLREKAAEETRKLVERTAPTPTPTPMAVTPEIVPPVKETAPPLVQPVPMNAVPNAPARALPVDANKLTPVRIAAYQVVLERMHFSCGFIDGDDGMRTQRMLRAYQASHGLPATGLLDPATRDAIGEPGEPFLNYVVTDKDIASIMPKPPTWMAKSKATRLGYNDIWEMLAEKFHCTRGYLKALNPGVTQLVAGTEIIGPKVFPATPIPRASSLRILLSETSIEALDGSGKIIAFFPCSIAKDKAKRPHGLLTVKVVDPNPDYTFDPALFVDASKEEGITHKLTIPPGPRNPVGTTWVGLSLPGYGIHGTPEPENISRTQSHGCFRLANWNAEKVLKMVKIGTPVDVED